MFFYMIYTKRFITPTMDAQICLKLIRHYQPESLTLLNSVTDRIEVSVLSVLIKNLQFY